MLKALPKSTALITLIIGGVALGLAWLYPNSTASAHFGVVSLSALLYPISKNHFRYQGYFLFGLIANLIAFYWLVSTIEEFGGYPSIVSFGLYVLFAIYHAILFPIFIFLTKRLLKVIPRNPILAGFLSWCFVKFFYPEIFPWDFAHTISFYRPFIQIADIGGPILVTGLLFAICNLLFQIIERQFKISFYVNLVLVASCLIYGQLRINHFTQITAPEKKISIIQSEVSIQKSQGISYLSADPNRYLQLSLLNLPEFQPDLTIWPETVIINPVPETTSFVEEFDVLPYLPTSSLITGSLSYYQEKNFNSAFAILPSGQVLKPYHKQILMPFGEFMPFSETFPFLADLNPNFAPITAGKESSIFNLDSGIKAVPLICYEDLSPAISREAIRQGGNLLVNLTNDAWFGKSIAPYQHNLIASFRAIENRRYLARATNSGLSSVIDPTGLIIEEIPLFTEGIINTKIKLLDSRTIYTHFYGSYFWLMLVIISTTIIIFSYIFKK